MTNIESTSNDKPFVEAVPLPWTVSVTVAKIYIVWNENGECVVYCDAFFGNHLEEQYKRVAIGFKDCISLRSQVKIGDGEVIGGDAYDWSRVKRPRIRTSGELTAWLAAFAAEWSSTSICPNPHFYRVSGSSWAAAFQNGYQHFIVEGTDSHVELLATSFAWTVESDLDS